jgi:hypothetical protein
MYSDCIKHLITWPNNTHIKAHANMKIAGKTPQAFQPFLIISENIK